VHIWHLKMLLLYLVHPPEYDMHTQAHLLAALHNFICDYNPFEISDLDDINNNQPGPQLRDQASTGDLADGILQRAEREKADNLQQSIVKAIWEDYRQKLHD
jgi:hypothetical protein